VSAFKPVQCRIDGPFGQIKGSAALRAQRLRDLVAVRWLPLQRSEEEEIEMAF
jgi:hypothetical protein